MFGKISKNIIKDETSQHGGSQIINVCSSTIASNKFLLNYCLFAQAVKMMGPISEQIMTMLLKMTMNLNFHILHVIVEVSRLSTYCAQQL